MDWSEIYCVLWFPPSFFFVRFPWFFLVSEDTWETLWHTAIGWVAARKPSNFSYVSLAHSFLFRVIWELQRIATRWSRYAYFLDCIVAVSRGRHDVFSHSGDFLWKREHSGSQKHRPDHLQIRCWKVGNFPLHKFSNQRHSCRGVGSSRMNLSVNSSCFPSWLHPRYNSFGRIVSPIRILLSSGGVERYACRVTQPSRQQSTPPAITVTVFMSAV